MPQDKDSYIHRVGRTGRAGHEGKAISLVTKDDLFTLYEIEEHIGTLIYEAELPTDEELAEEKELADAWKKAHALKSEPEKQAPKSSPRKSKKKRKKPYQRKPYQKGGTQKQGQRQKPKTDKKEAYDRRKTTPAARQKQQVTVSKPQRTDKQKVQAPAAPEKKPLLKRLLGRIFG